MGARSLSTDLKRLDEAFERTRVRTTSRRPATTRRLPDRDFALPEKREFPIHDREHAALALEHLARLGTVKKDWLMAREVLRVIHVRWPGVYRQEADTVRRAKRAHGVA